MVSRRRRRRRRQGRQWRVSRTLPLATAAPTVNESDVENGAEEESKREKERKGGLAGNDGVSVYRAQRGAK